MRRGTGEGWFVGTALLKRAHEVLFILLSNPRWQFGLQKLSTTLKWDQYVHVTDKTEQNKYLCHKQALSIYLD
jgi:hypothetical protein